MTLKLQILTGRDVDKSVALTPGQRIRVGRSPSVDFSCPNATTLAASHFSVEATDRQARLTVAEGVSPVLVNGKPVRQSDLMVNDIIECGGMSFRILQDTDQPVIDPHESQDEQPSHSATPDNAVKPIDEPTDDMVEVVKSVELASDVIMLLDMNESIVFNIDLLRSKGFESEALTIYVRSMSKRSAVEWGITCLEATLQEKSLHYDERALRAAKAWVVEPIEANRRECESAAAAANYADPAAFLAQAAFWSGGSIGPASSPAETPTQDHLTAVAVAAAINQIPQVQWTV